VAPYSAPLESISRPAIGYQPATPPVKVYSKAAWTENTIYKFRGGKVGSADGYLPEGTLVADSSGALYGTTNYGGTAAFGSGAVFRLAPPTPGKTVWTETILHSFSGGADGGGFYAGVIQDKTGALYGAAVGGGAGGYGAVFKLTQ